MSEENSAKNLRLETWMSDLPPQLKDVPLIYLAIPGSHNSMTYGITRSNGLGPDAEPILHRLYRFFRGTILNWSITQAIDTRQQLLIGIRYLDLRLATKEGEENFYFTHGVYADEITTALNQVKEFVDTHPGEVVILDCQHFYGFKQEDHERLIRLLLTLYGPQLVPRQLDLRNITLHSLSRLKQQVIVVYRHQSAYTKEEFWLQQMMPAPWPRQEEVNGLVSYLQNVCRHPQMGFVHQAVITPTPAFIILSFISNLRDKCAAPVVKDVLPKLSEFSPGPPSPDNGPGIQATVNVIIADFVDINDAEFPRTVIQLNMKLLKNSNPASENS